MALPVTDQLITQMMTENVRTSPTTPMEGNVSRPMIVSDLSVRCQPHGPPSPRITIC